MNSPGQPVVTKDIFIETFSPKVTKSAIRPHLFCSPLALHFIFPVHVCTQLYCLVLPVTRCLGWPRSLYLSRNYIKLIAKVQEQAKSGLWADSFHLLRPVSPPSISSPLTFIVLATTPIVAPIYILQSHMITTLQVAGIKGSRGHKLVPEWISSEADYFF